MSPRKQRDAIIAPFIVEPTGVWDGVDGNWTSFAVSVGTPPQSFRVLPATLNAGITVPDAGACQGWLSNVTDCENQRGSNSNNGFNLVNSNTWVQNSIYKVFQQQTFYDETGVYGTDTVSIGRSGGSNNATVQRQTVITISQIDFWLGSIGLSSSSSTLRGYTPQTLLTSLKNASVIPSLSFGYTAGQHYNNNFGSLILGGYDSSKVGSSIVSTQINSSGLPTIQIPVSSIIASNSLSGGQRQLLPNTISATIDSSVNQIWLPGAACDAFADSFGLTYDSTHNLYLVNDTIHQSLLSKNPSVTFTIGGQNVGSQTNIVFSYKSLDLVLGESFTGSSSVTYNYFPIRQAMNDSQIVLGRAFLQEAYLFVDWERNNFTISPLVNPSSSANVIAITPPAAASASASASGAASSASPTPVGNSSGGLSGGAIAGIVIPIVVVIAAIGAFVFWWRRRRQRHIDARKSVETQPPAYDEGAEYYGQVKSANNNDEGKAAPQETMAELFDSSPPRAELTSDNVRRLEEIAQERELMSTPVMELEGNNVVGSELEDSSVRPESSIRPDRSSVASPERRSLMSPTRQSLASPPERVRSPLSESSVFELE